MYTSAIWNYTTQWMLAFRYCSYCTYGMHVCMSLVWIVDCTKVMDRCWGVMLYGSWVLVGRVCLYWLELIQALHDINVLWAWYCVEQCRIWCTGCTLMYRMYSVDYVHLIPSGNYQLLSGPRALMTTGLLPCTWAGSSSSDVISLAMKCQLHDTVFHGMLCSVLCG